MQLEITLSEKESYTPEQEKQMLENIAKALVHWAECNRLEPERSSGHAVGIKISSGKLSAERIYLSGWGFWGFREHL